MTDTATRPPAAVTLLLGGTRSGKSELAERLTTSWSGPLLYVATARVDDADMADRVARHVARRDPRFHTVDAGDDLAGSLRDAPAHPALVDALGPWVARFVDAPDPAAWEATLDDLCDALAGRGAPTVVVSEEVGLSVHPTTRAGRRFTDLLGLANQRVAALADRCWLVVAGRVLALHPAAALLPDGPPSLDPGASSEPGGALDPGPSLDPSGSPGPAGGRP